MSNPPKSALEYFNATATFYETSTGGSTRDVAQHIISILPPVTSSSVILDNACGTGIVVRELFNRKDLLGETIPTIHCVDGVPAMVDLARKALDEMNVNANAKFDVMSGEELGFPDNSFTHSITNLGILFFSDGMKGAKEIYRTLQPGGTAIVTSWRDLGYLDIVHQAQRAIGKVDNLFKIPVPDQWFTAEHLEMVLREAGFKDVQIKEQEAFYAAESTQKLSELLITLFRVLMDSQSEGEKDEFQRVVLKTIEERAVPCRDGTAMGVQMKALVGIARK